jgi:hypothetical protein
MMEPHILYLNLIQDLRLLIYKTQIQINKMIFYQFQFFNYFILISNNHFIIDQFILLLNLHFNFNYLIHFQYVLDLYSKYQFFSLFILIYCTINLNYYYYYYYL